MTGIDRLANDGVIYVAGRLFDIEEKIKSELLEQAILAGLPPAARRATFVPFRDAGQEELVVEDKTRRLYELDLARMARCALLVAYIDGLAKDEGVCFEIGYAYGMGIPIMLISTDFFTIELSDGHEAPLDPLLMHAATHLIRQPQLLPGATFLDSLLATRATVLQNITLAVPMLLDNVITPRTRTTTPGQRPVLVEFGGNVFEWQDLLFAYLREHTTADIARTSRYDGNTADDIEALETADLLITCTDSDEAPAGTAFLQGMAVALGIPVWMYNSKRIALRAAGGYRSSRNLMLDYSATVTYRTIRDLATALNARVSEPT